MSKNSATFRFLSWTCILVICNSCVFYKTITVPVNSQSLIEHQFKRAKWTIADRNGTVKGLVPTIRNDSIFGNLFPIEKFDHPKELNTSDTYKARKGPDSKDFLHLYSKYPLYADEIKIPISDLTLATKHVKAHGLGIATTLGISTGVLVTGTIIIALIACNCPYVSAVGADTTTFQGSLFPGSISKSLEREDNLVMDTVPLSQDGTIHVRINNELPEIEYFNKIELFEVGDIPHRYLGQLASGNPVSYNLQNHLQDATTLSNVDIKEEIQSVNGGFFDFNDQADDYDLNNVFVTFKRKNLTEDAMLIVRAKQSKWMETVAAYTFQQFGTAFGSWVKRLDKADPKKYNQSMIDKGISMNAYIKQNNQWDYIGSYSNAGTLAYRDLALNVDLSKVKEENIEIKLEAAHGFWDIDYVGLTDEWSEKINLTKLKTISAVNYEGAPISIEQGGEVNRKIYLLP